MRRSRNKKSEVGVALFPFLAVLICTMGALIVLLVLVVHMARVDAAESSDADDPLDQVDARRVELEDYQWRRELLEQQRAQVREDVARKRLELSHLENHIRELEQRYESLRESAADLQLRLASEHQDQSAIQGQLTQLQDAIRVAKQELETAREKTANRRPVYSIVPYDGPNGTHRRPVYVECTEQNVIIQPEGIALTPRDFAGPLGPGNPLDAALRAVREYFDRLGTDHGHGEPYPLLIVRPGGVDAYAMARSAMRAWDDEFGYELVEQDMQIQYSEADPALARLLEKVVADARSRQEILAAAMPSRFEQPQDVGFVASGRGGFVPQGGSAQPGFGARQGGFGQGGDQRYIDGQRSGTTESSATPVEEQTVGGPAEQGHAEGAAGAQMGTGVSPLSRQRGRNWGLPNGAAHATGIVRPISIACLPDRIILLPERGEAQTPEVVLIDGRMADEVDQLVSKIWDRVEYWGIAVAGGYWKPVLRVQVAQGGNERFEELKILLDGSGLGVERSGQ